MRNYLTSALFVATLLLSNLLSAQNSNNLFFVFLNTNPDRAALSEQEVESLQSQHLNNIKNLADQGIMKAAGPFDGGGGMFILAAEDGMNAWDILNTDPAIAANRYKIELYPVEINNNDICDVSEPYKMVNYQFVRLTSDPDYFGDSDKLFRENRVFNANLNNNNDFVMVQGIFNMFNDGFIVLNVPTAEEASKIMSNHPSVKAGQVKMEVKTLWIAEGTFCKK